MQLPLGLPPEFEDLHDQPSEVEVFARLAAHPARAIHFLEVAGGDETWVKGHAPLVRKILKWLTHLFYKDQLNMELVAAVQKLMHEESALLAPYQYYDMIVRAGDQELAASSLLLGAASPFFLRLIRQVAAKSEPVLTLHHVDPLAAKFIFEILHRGTHHLWRLEKSDLERILNQCQFWELEEIALECEELLVRYITFENVVAMLFKARENRWFRLEAAATEVYNRQEIGLKIFAPEPGVLGAEFLDLKELTTMAALAQIAPLISICKFTGHLAADPDFLTALKHVPKLQRLDLSETERAPEKLDMLPLSLRSLVLTRAHWLTDAWMERFVHLYPQLTQIYLQDITWVGLGTWSALASLQDLQELDLTGLKQLEDTDLSLLALHPPALEKLSLAKCTSLTPYGLQEIIRAAKRLTTLSLAYTAASDVNLADITRHLPQIKSLDLSHVPAITERGIASLLKQCPTLRLLNLTSSPLAPETLQQLRLRYPATIFS